MSFYINGKDYSLNKNIQFNLDKQNIISIRIENTMIFLDKDTFFNKIKTFESFCNKEKK